MLVYYIAPDNVKTLLGVIFYANFKNIFLITHFLCLDGIYLVERKKFFQII